MSQGPIVAKASRVETVGRHRAVTLGVALLLAGGVAALQGAVGLPQVPKPTPAGAGAISGIVVDASDGRPLPGSIVFLGIRVQGAVSGTPRTVTDSKGRFVFRNLVASNEYFVHAGRIGYFDGSFGSELVDDLGRLISLRDGQWFPDAVIKLSKPAAVSGRVLDEDGEPVVGAFVNALAQVMVAGKLVSASGSIARTDDRGQYRLRGLVRGSYLISLPSPQYSTLGGLAQNDLALDADQEARLLVSEFRLPPPSSTSRRQTYPMIFFPGVPSANLASPIQVDFGEERAGVDLTWNPMPAVAVSGHLQGPAEALSDLTVRLVAVGNESLGPGTETATTKPDQSGRFTLLNVPPGQYRLQANQISVSYHLNPAIYDRSEMILPSRSPQAPYGGAVMSGPLGMTFRVFGRQSEAYWADTPLNVGDVDVTDLSIPLRPTIRISGRLVVESATGKTPEFSAVRVALEPADSSAQLGLSTGQLNPQTREFTVGGLRSGKYVVRASLPNGWTVKSTKCSVRDCSDGEIDTTSGFEVGSLVITVADQISELRGRILGPQGEVVEDCVVWAFPVQPSQWTGYGVTPRRIRQARVSGPAGYVIRGLPAGDYFLVALPASNLQGWSNPAALAAAARVSTSIRLGWGESQTRDLTLREIK
jgi:hypothetical protein